ncbi:MAG: MFS transporter [Bacteroidota bacterium]
MNQASLKEPPHPMPSNKGVMQAVLVAALGYFVDIYDLVLFSIVRVSSLRDLGIAASQMEADGVYILNMQMVGMLLGGIAWGIMGDKVGRRSVLFGSILLYSMANLANAWVESVEQYAWIRLIAGFGLAGELGAGITLVSELMTPERRGHGTTVVATVGAAGAILAGVVASNFAWQTAYVVGGVLGFSLLLLRFGALESGMFQQVLKADVSRGAFWKLFTPGTRALLFLNSILIGVPIWFCVGILITFSPELAQELGIQGVVNPAYAVMATYAGLTVGDFLSGALSQWFQTRKKIVRGFLYLTAVTVGVYLSGWVTTLNGFYCLCAVLGLATGYWAVFVTMASEHFGTNLRATATTSVPNFVRGSTVLITLGYRYGQQWTTKTYAAMAVGMICLGLAFVALSRLHETWGRDLDFQED